MLQGKFRTSTSELVCKHRVLPEAAEAGHFTFPFSQRAQWKVQTHNVASDWLNSKRFLLKGSVQVSWLKNKCFEKHVARPEGPWLLLLDSLPLGSARSRFRVKAKCILLYSGLRIKK